jgi:hypothetical protein
MLTEAFNFVSVSISVATNTVESVGDISKTIRHITSAVERTTGTVMPMIEQSIINSYTKSQSDLLDQL